MKRRHAAVLVLVGWYLMVPKVFYQPSHGWLVGPYKDNSPDFSAWEQVGSYDTAAECHSAIAALDLEKVWDFTGPGVRRDPQGLKKALRAAEGRALCIATDDPRLAR